MHWTIYPAFIATALSIGGLTPIAVRGYRKTNLASICEMAATLRPSLVYFRFILWTCGTLFAITMYAFVIPRINFAPLVAAAWTVEYVGDIAIAAIPARPKTMRLHTSFAQAMGYGMLSLAYLFALSLHGSYTAVELGLAIIMTLLGIMTYLDRKQYVFYQAPFVYLSHITILIAVIALL